MAMRLLVPALLLAVAFGEGQQCPLRKLLEPYLGNFSMDDVAEAMDSIKQCAALPGDYSEFYNMGQCSKGLVDNLEVGAVQGLMMAKQFVNMSEVPVPEQVVEVLSELGAKYLEKAAHEFQQKFCGFQECSAKMFELSGHVGGCEAGYMCALLTAQGVDTIPFGQCKRVVQEAMGKIMGGVNGEQCQVEASGAFCPEMLQSMLIQDFECYLNMFTPNQKCSDQCQKTWAALKAKYPVCSHAYSSAAADIANAAQEMAHQMVPSSPAPPPVKPFEEVCGTPSLII